MGASRRKLGGVVLAAVLIAGTTAGAAAADPGRAELRQALTQLAEAGVAGVQLRVHDEQGDWTGSAGVRTLSGGKVPTNGRFRAGSITKTFVSTVVLQLVGEGRVALDDPVDEYLPKYGLDPRITVRMLLQHTSGLFNYTGERNPDGSFEPGIPLIGQNYVDNQFRRYPPDELIAVSLAKPARFEPGASWSYSNTNYILAGQLIQRLTGTPYDVQVRDRILRPLGLRETVLPGQRTGIPGPHAHGYYAFSDAGQARVADVSRIHPSWAGSAGEIISTTRDLDRFITALLGGRLLPADLLAEMSEASPFETYGLGLAMVDARPACEGGQLYLGHDGGMPGYSSYMFSTADGSDRFEMSITSGAADLSDPEVAQRVGAAVENILVLVACGTPIANRPLLAEHLAVA